MLLISAQEKTLKTIEAFLGNLYAELLYKGELLLLEEKQLLEWP